MEGNDDLVKFHFTVAQIKIPLKDRMRNQNWVQGAWWWASIKIRALQIFILI